MSPDIFERYELKYLVNSWQRNLLEQGIRDHMVPDPHGQSTICNLYCDTPDFRLIRQSLEGPVYKEKLRLRSYGPALPNAPVFLELKKKYKGIVYKRRISLPEPDAMRFFTANAPLPGQSQIGRELTWCRDFYRPLAPVVYLSYDREAYFGKDDPNLRLTFDRNICWRNTELRLGACPGGQSLLEPGQSLLEIKVADAVPMWLVHLANACQLRKASFSKYGRAYEQLLRQRLKESRGCFCA